MSLRVYNTLSRQKEPFEPIEPGIVRMYVCGVTVYDLCHIGHARAGIVFDVISRYLRYVGYDVTYVRNITDIDDKIINRANETGEVWDSVATHFTDAFHRDMGQLNLTDPEEEPKATEHIPEMLQMIGALIDKGHAYATNDGSVYFSVRSFPEYGRLSGKNIEELESGARVEVDETKRDPLDFALWKGAKPGEPSWESPWGAGRPGWHIECSAMGRKYLGETFDIHGGGKDLVFPHHENEVAQSHASSGAAPVKYWIHNGFVTVAKEKMSKSLGNFFTIQDLLEQHHPESVRLFLLSSHYRSPIDFADTFLADSFKSLTRFYELFAYAEALDPVKLEDSTVENDLRTSFMEMMNDDFNTATAIALLQGELKRLNQIRAELDKQKKKSDLYRRAKDVFLSETQTVRELGNVLGLFEEEPASFLLAARLRRLAEIGLTEEEVEEQIAKRTEARQAKNYEESDRLRDELAAKGIELHDTPGGVTWTVRFD